MGLIVHWTDFAKKELKSIFDYHHKKVSLKIAKQITKKIAESTKELSDFPEMGPTEEFLNDRPQNFRYLISTNYKIIYYINKDKDRIEILDVFDTRQNPVKINRAKQSP